MGFITRLLQPTEPVERRTMTLADLDSMMDAAVTGRPSSTGLSIDPDRSLANTAVFACVRVLSETLAGLPLPVFERKADGSKERAQGHPLYPILHDAPNAEMTAFEYRECMMGHLALWGNHYSEIVRDGYTGDVRALWPLRPDKMQLRRSDANRIEYVYRMPDGTDKVWQAQNILHVRGLGSNGIIGYSPVSIAREAVGLGLATELYGASFFGNGARPGAVLLHPGVLSDEAHSRLRKSWENRHQGLSNAQRVAILEEGMTIETIGVPPEDAQFLETRRFQVNEIARLFRVPPHMIGDLDRATFSNIEQQSIEFVVHTITPWAERIEQRLAQSLIVAVERDRYYIEHVVDGLLRGDIQSRYEAYATGRQWGWLSANDIRQLENMNPVDGGDIYLSPMNMVAADQGGFGYAAPPPKEEAEPETRALPEPEHADARPQELRIAQDRRALANAYQPTLAHVAQRVVNREVNDVMNAARRLLQVDSETNTTRALPEFEQWLREFDAQHRTFVHEYLSPALRTYLEIVSQDVRRETGREPTGEDWERWANGYIDGRVNAWMGDLMGDIRAGLQPPDDPSEYWQPYTGLTTRLDKRKGKFADGWSFDELIRGLGAVAVTLYAMVGIAYKRWMEVGDSCPWCSQLNGNVVSVDFHFFGPGQELLHGGEKFMTKTYVGHPPLHRGCDCVVVAAESITRPRY